MEQAELTAIAIGAAIEVQKVLGPGLLESTYAAALAHELKLRGIHHERERAIPVRYKNVEVGLGFRADFIIDQQLVLELKAVEALLPVHRAQLLSYLRLSGHRLGLLINFHQWPLRQGVQRVIDPLSPS